MFEIPNPFDILGINILKYKDTTCGSGLFLIMGNLIRMFIVIAAIYTFWNLLTAGFGFINANGEAKAIQKAWDRIWQSLIGLVIVAGAFVLAAIFGWLIFQNPSFLLQPQIIGPDGLPCAPTLPIE